MRARHNRQRQEAALERGENPTERLVAADEGAARAARRLRRLQARALEGAGYDADTFDAAILAQRQAQVEAAAARAAWVRWRQSQAIGRLDESAA